MPAFQAAGQQQGQQRKMLSKSGERRSREPRSARRNSVLARDDRGNVIGEVVAPVDEAVFGFGRGSVYLLRGR